MNNKNFLLEDYLLSFNHIELLYDLYINICPLNSFTITRKDLTNFLTTICKENEIIIDEDKFDIIYINIDNDRDGIINFNDFITFISNILKIIMGLNGNNHLNKIKNIISIEDKINFFSLIKDIFMNLIGNNNKDYNNFFYYNYITENYIPVYKFLLSKINFKGLINNKNFQFKSKTFNEMILYLNNEEFLKNITNKSYEYFKEIENGFFNNNNNNFIFSLNNNNIDNDDNNQYKIISNNIIINSLNTLKIILKPINYLQSFFPLLPFLEKILKGLINLSKYNILKILETIIETIIKENKENLLCFDLIYLFLNIIYKLIKLGNFLNEILNNKEFKIVYFYLKNNEQNLMFFIDYIDNTLIKKFIKIINVIYNNNNNKLNYMLDLVCIEIAKRNEYCFIGVINNTKIFENFSNNFNVNEIENFLKKNNNNNNNLIIDNNILKENGENSIETKKIYLEIFTKLNHLLYISINFIYMYLNIFKNNNNNNNNNNIIQLNNFLLKIKNFVLKFQNIFFELNNINNKETFSNTCNMYLILLSIINYTEIEFENKIFLLKYFSKNLKYKSLIFYIKSLLLNKNDIYDLINELKILNYFLNDNFNDYFDLINILINSNKEKIKTSNIIRSIINDFVMILNNENIEKNVKKNVIYYLKFISDYNDIIINDFIIKNNLINLSFNNIYFKSENKFIFDNAIINYVKYETNIFENVFDIIHNLFNNFNLNIDNVFINNFDKNFFDVSYTFFVEISFFFKILTQNYNNNIDYILNNNNNNNINQEIINIKEAIKFYKYLNNDNILNLILFIFRKLYEFFYVFKNNNKNVLIISQIDSNLFDIQNYINNMKNILNEIPGFNNNNSLINKININNNINNNNNNNNNIFLNSLNLNNNSPKIVVITQDDFQIQNNSICTFNFDTEVFTYENLKQTICSEYEKEMDIYYKKDENTLSKILNNNDLINYMKEKIKYNNGNIEFILYVTEKKKKNFLRLKCTYCNNDINYEAKLNEFNQIEIEDQNDLICKNCKNKIINQYRNLNFTTLGNFVNNNSFLNNTSLNNISAFSSPLKNNINISGINTSNSNIRIHSRLLFSDTNSINNNNNNNK